MFNKAIFRDFNIIKSNIDNYFSIYYKNNKVFNEVLKQFNTNSDIPYQWTVIPKNQYINALKRFVQQKFISAPKSLLLNWIDIICHNIILLNMLSVLQGHGNNGNLERLQVDLKDIYNTNFKSTSHIAQFLKNKKFFEWLRLPDGEAAFSDTIILPIVKILLTLELNPSESDVILCIDKCLQVAHSRSDISKIFIEGGKLTLNEIFILNI